MDKRDLAQGFRARFSDVVEAERPALTPFLKACGIDRSALSQFLDPNNDRLPRAETLHRIAPRDETGVYREKGWNCEDRSEEKDIKKSLIAIQI